MASDGGGFPDYYEVLGIAPTATFADIERAYREAALKHHPDRGGSHKKMLLVNEAWLNLSDPELRLAYDAYRCQRASSTAQSEWQDKSRNARDRAATYPRDWSRFWQWVEEDVSKADYGQLGNCSLENPFKLWGQLGGVVGKSKSGTATASIIGGGALGLALVALSPVGLPTMAFLMAPTLGAWAGIKVHKAIRAALQSGGGATTGRPP